MAIREYIENTPVFTVQDMQQACGEGMSNVNLLSRAKANGKVVAVSKGVYVSNTGRYRASEVDPFLVAEALGRNVIFAYGSALSLFAGNQDVAYVVSFFADNRSATFSFNDHTFRRYQGNGKRRTKLYSLPTGQVFKGTTPEQTVADCLKKPERCGGIEALLRSLSVFPFIDSEALADIAIEDSAAQAARIGWLLGVRKEIWYVPESVISRLHSVLGDSTYQLGRKNPNAGGFSKKWKLHLPEDEDTLIEWLGA